MSSDQNAVTFRRLALGLMLGAASLMASCQVRPLYSVDAKTSDALKTIAFSPATTRVGQVVRNELIFLTSGGAGESTAPLYQVDLIVTPSTLGTLYIGSSDSARSAIVKVTGQYFVRKLGDPTVLKSGTRFASASMDYSNQQFATTRAMIDAENRAAKELAEMIRADLAGMLGR